MNTVPTRSVSRPLARTALPVDAVFRKASQALSTRLRVARLAVGLTQAALANKAGVTVETVARIERVIRGRISGNTNPSLETLVRLAYALGIDAAGLIGGAT